MGNLGDRSARRRLASLAVEPCRWKVAHALARSGAWRIVAETEAARGGTLLTCWCRSFFRQVDQVLANLMVGLPIRVRTIVGNVRRKFFPAGRWF